MSNITMQQLYEEYENALKIQNDVIMACRAELAVARRELRFCDIKHICFKLSVFYRERGELVERCEGLRKYIED